MDGKLPSLFGRLPRQPYTVERARIIWRPNTRVDATSLLRFRAPSPDVIGSDPYADFGRLTYEMWRACRLVVDTELHWQRWSREQAMKYLADRKALSLHEVRTETDRYISWPGQALAYKMGELTIRRLRGEAEQALGARFNVRGFHDAVLANGPVPLGVLEQQIHAWVRTQRDSTN